jgi:anti-anti-sigma factor
VGGMEESRLSAKLTEIDGVPVLQVHGEIDLYTAPEFRDALQQGVGQDPRALIVDLSDISYIDSAGLGALLAAFKMLSVHDAELYIVTNPQSPGVRRVMEITRLDTLMKLYDSLDDALKDLAIRKAA